MSCPPRKRVRSSFTEEETMLQGNTKNHIFHVTSRPKILIFLRVGTA
jgi:hypothetical protein